MLMGRSILDWLKRPSVTNGRDEGLAPLIHPRLYSTDFLSPALPPKPDLTLTPQLAPEKIRERLYSPDVTLTPQPVEEKIMENNEWYKEQWATDLMGEVASIVFKRPAEEPVASPQQPAKGTDLGATIQFGDWTLVVSIISIVALILLFFFLRQRPGRAY